jgi:hypothetical protein
LPTDMRRWGLGKGCFGQILKCMDHRQKALIAVKIIRNKRRFHQQALVEVKILEHLREKVELTPIVASQIFAYI